MKINITHNRFNFLSFRVFVVTLILLSSITAVAQTYMVVDSVFPRRVTTKTEVTVIGKAGANFTSTTPISCAGIFSTGTKEASASGTQLNFTISKSDLFVVSPPHNDRGKTSLKIDGKDVYVGSYAESNKVFLEYIAPREKNYVEGSDFGVTEVFTNWDQNGNSFWRSGTEGTGGKPNDRHDLLAFKYGGRIFSTGVKDVTLTNNNVEFEPHGFRAYSTNGISGNAHSDNYLAMADLIDGSINKVEKNDRISATVYDAIIEGANGLGMGTGITNFNQNASISFFSANGKVGAIDDIPDLLITQIAQPGTPDIYYYADVEGNVVGRPIRLKITGISPILFTWKLDLYRIAIGVPYAESYPTGAGFSSRQERDFRMVAFKLSDFEIDDNSLKKVNNINMMAGGTADIAFMAYNKATFPIKSPEIDEFPVSRNICELSNAIEVTFKTKASIDGIDTGDPKETLSYQWYRNFDPIPGATADSYTLPSAITESDLITYKVRVKNGYGAVDLPVKLSKGGIPTYWNGPHEGWVFPSNYYNGASRAKSNLKFTIEDADRNLIFAEDYSENVDLNGCECKVLAGKNVTIRAGKQLKLYNSIVVDDAVPSIGGALAIPAGAFTLENNASLIQTKKVTQNENRSEIKVERIAKGLKKYDYVYWSSPVADNKVENLPGTLRFEWDVYIKNTKKSTGNWVNASGSMKPGKGYIARVTNPSVAELKEASYSRTNNFRGVPNNGDYSINVLTSPEPMPSDGDRDLNLLGNPYPSAISADKFLKENENLKGYIQVWTHGFKVGKSISPFYGDFVYNYSLENFLTYNLTASTVPEYDGNIPSGQGFFVKAISEGSVKFTNEMRYNSVSKTAYDNTQFYRGSVNDNEPSEVDSEKQLIWLALTNESNTATVAVVGYVEGATYDEDRLYDAKVNPDNEFRLYSNIGNNGMIIQGRPLPFDNQDKVSLGFAVPKNGIYKIAIDNLEGSLMLDEAQGIFIEDTYMGTIHNLKTSPYSFTTNAGNFKDRFVLRYTEYQLSIDDQQLTNTFAYIKNEQLFVKASNPIESVVVYDLTGKKLMDYRLDGYTDRFNTQFQFSKGAYLTVIKLENAATITKKVIN